MVEERSKRALPARHSFLTDAVSSVLESQSKLQVPQVDSRTILKLDQDTRHCIIHGGPTPPPRPSTDNEPVFRILPLRRPIKAKKSTAFSDDYYIARHRKHEMEEKKQKNREKERLEHELYQQQQLVERLKTLDKSTLVSIVSSLRNQPVMNSSELERLHQTLLQDAREQMYRYEQLGLGRKRGQGFAYRLPQPHSPPPSPPSSTSSASLPPPAKPNDDQPTKKSQEAERVLAYFKAHRQPSTGGKRKSLRTAMAFGEKIPPIAEIEFNLPQDIFGDLMVKRTRRRRTA